MRNLSDLDGFRIRSDWVLKQFGSYGDSYNGAFLIPVVGQQTKLKVVAANGGGWDHVSVSPDGESRTPTWAEMDFIKRIFFKPKEIAWEYHMNEDDHISIHPYVLHIWRKHNFKMPTPPKVFV